MCFMKNKGEKAQNNAKPGILVEYQKSPYKQDFV